MNLVRRTGIVLVPLFAVGLLPGVAYANHGGQATTGVLNTAKWQVCRAGTSAGIDATNRALHLIKASTVDPVGVPCSSGGQNVNVWSTDTVDSPHHYGATYCTGTYNSTNNRCSSKTVWLFANSIEVAANPAKQWQQTACHELGHVGGLGHRPSGVTTSCLASGESPPIYTIYDSHDIASLNDSYS